MASSASSTCLKLVLVCALICCTYPASVLSKPSKSSTEVIEKKLMKSFDAESIPADEENWSSLASTANIEAVSVTKRPPENLRKPKKSSATKSPKQESEGTTEKLQKKVSKSSEDLFAASAGNDEKTIIRKKKADSAKATAQDYPENQEHSSSEEVGFEARFAQKKHSEENSVSGERASNDGSSESSERAEGKTTDKKAAAKHSKSDSNESADDASAEPLPSAARQRGKIPATTPSSTTVTASTPAAVPGAGTGSPGAACTLLTVLATYAVSLCL